MNRRFKIEPLESRRLLAVTGSISGFAYLDTHNFGTKDADEAGFAGLTVRLKNVDGQGNLSDVSGVGPVQTVADGSYGFSNLAAGTYQIQISPSAKMAVGTLSPGSAGGTAGSNEIQLTLPAGQSATNYNFAILGAATNQISLRMFLSSTGSLTQFLTTLHAQPLVEPGAGGSSTFAASYSTGGAGTAIVASSATIASTDSPTLTSMTVTIENLQNGSSEQLSAVTTGTTLTSSYANGVLTVSGVADVATYQTVLRSVQYRITSSPASLGNRTISIVVNDGTTASTAATTTVAVVQGTGPSGYTIAADKAQVNAAAATSAGFTFGNAVVGATYSYTVTSSGGGSAVTGSGTVSSTTQDVTGVNVSALLNGTLTYSVTLTDSSGQTGTPATATATLDRIAPSGYTITAKQAVVNRAASTNTGFTFAAAEVNTTYNYTVTSSGGSASVTGSGSVTSATQQVTAVNVSSLADGTLTFSVTLSDPAGNVGSSTTATATLNTQVPSGYSIVADRTPINASQAVSTGFTFATATTGTTYNLTVTSSGGSGSVTNSGSVTSATQDITGINVASLPDGVLTYSVTLTNSAGNTGAATTATATLDKTAPSGYTITAVPAALNASAAASAGFKFTGAEAGATYSYSISGSGGSPITGSGSVTSATQSVGGINLVSFSDGNLTYSVTLTDTAGNVGSAAIASGVVDRVAPDGYSIAANQVLVNIPASTNTGFTFTAGEVNATYKYTVTSEGGGTPVSGSGTVTSTTQQITGANVSSLADGTLTFSVTLTDPAGNVGNPVTATATLNTQAPSGYTITAGQALINANQAASIGFTFANATTAAGTTYNYTISSDGGGTPVTGSGTVTSATQAINGINVASLHDGALTYSVTLTNSMGNPGHAATATATLDKTAPNGYTISAIPAALNATTSAAAGLRFSAAEGNATYTYSISSDGGGTPITGSGQVTSATETISGINISSLSSGNLTYSVTLTDPAGNVGTATTASGVLDRNPPSGYTITANQAVVNHAAASNTGFTFIAAEKSATYNYTISSDGGGSPITGSGSVTSVTQQVTGISVSSLADGTLTFSVTLTDPAGNTGLPTSATATLNTVAPSGYSIVADQAVLGPANDAAASFTLSGGVAGETYSYSVTSSNGGSPVTGSGAVTATTQHVTPVNVSALPGGTLTYSVTLTNSVGNPGAAATATATLNKTAPSGYTVTANPQVLNATTVLTAGFNLNSAIQGGKYTYSITSSGGGTAVTGSGNVTSAAQSVSGISVGSLGDGTLTYSVTLTDPVGNVGLPATASGTLDTKAPSGYTITANQAVIDLAASTNTSFTLAGAEGNATYRFSVTSTGGGTAVTGSGSVTSATQQVSGVNVSSLGDGALTYSVVLTDLAGNAGTASTAPAALAKAAPTGYSILPDFSTFNALTATGAGFKFSNAEIGTTYNYTITSDNGGTPVTGSGTVISATQDVTGISLNGSDTVPKLNDGTITFSVTLTDAAGHVGAAATATAQVNRVAPDAFTVTPDQASYISTTATNVGFTIAPSEIGDSYSFYFISNGIPTNVRGHGTIISATTHLTGIDMSALPSGNYTLHVILTNAVGNATSENAGVSLNNPIPKFTINPDQSLLNSVAVASTGFTFAGATLGATYNYTITGSGGAPITGSGSVTSATQDISGINLSTLADGTVTFSVTLTNTAGTSAPATATATIDRTLPTALALSTSVAPAGAQVGSLVGLLQTAGPQSATGSYTYSLVSGNGSTDNAAFQISGNELQTGAVFDAGGQSSYNIRVRSTDSHGKFIEQQFLITLSNTDPVTPTVSISNTGIAAAQAAGTSVGTLSTAGSVVASQTNYALVSGAGSADNNLFQIVNGQLQTAGALASGTYTVRVRSSGTFLISDVVNLGGVAGPYALQLPYDPAQLPSGNYRLAAADAGLITLASDPAGSWYPAISQNKEAAGSLAEPNYLGSYSTFWGLVTTANSSATLSDVVGSSGIDQAAKTVWAVVDRPGEYAVGVQVFTEQVFTITVGQ